MHIDQKLGNSIECESREQSYHPDFHSTKVNHEYTSRIQLSNNHLMVMVTNVRNRKVLLGKISEDLYQHTGSSMIQSSNMK